GRLALMLYGALADIVLIVHLAFIVFVALGGFLAWRWPKAFWLHVPVTIYAAAIVLIGFECPLTPLEKHFRRLAGEPVYAGGFVDHYLTNVIYPGHWKAVLRWVVALAIATSYAGVFVKWRGTARRVGTDTPFRLP